MSTPLFSTTVLSNYFQTDLEKPCGKRKPI